MQAMWYNPPKHNMQSSRPSSVRRIAIVAMPRSAGSCDHRRAILPRGSFRGSFVAGGLVKIDPRRRAPPGYRAAQRRQQKPTPTTLRATRAGAHSSLRLRRASNCHRFIVWERARPRPHRLARARGGRRRAYRSPALAQVGHGTIESGVLRPARWRAVGTRRGARWRRGRRVPRRTGGAGAGG